MPLLPHDFTLGFQNETVKNLGDYRSNLYLAEIEQGWMVSISATYNEEYAAFEVHKLHSRDTVSSTVWLRQPSFFTYCKFKDRLVAKMILLNALEETKRNLGINS